MTVLSEIEATLKATIKQAVLEAGLAQEEEIPAIVLEKPKEEAHGDFATNIAMQLARVARKAPRQIAEDILAKFDKEKANVRNMEIAGPGFINFFMAEDFVGYVVPTILEQKDAYGRLNVGENERVQVEFVSVNPTGDLHLGHARGAAFGDVLCNVFAAAGFDVVREYYINDAGNLIYMLASSIEARYFQALGEEKP